MVYNGIDNNNAFFRDCIKWNWRSRIFCILISLAIASPSPTRRLFKKIKENVVNGLNKYYN